MNNISLSLEQQRFLANMLPEVIERHSNNKHSKLLWIKSGEYVSPTEYVHLVSLAEAKLTHPDDRDKYALELFSVVVGFSCDKDDVCVNWWTLKRIACTSPAQRLTALGRVLGKEVA